MAENNPYTYSDEYFSEIDRSTSGSGDTYEYAGHVFSEDRPCTKCKAFHYLPGLKDIDPHFSEYLSAILREFVHKFESENRFYASTTFFGMLELIINKFDFLHSYAAHRTAVVTYTMAQLTSNPDLNIPVDELVKINRAEFLLVSSAYQRGIINVFGTIKNNTGINDANNTEADETSRYISSAVDYFRGINDRMTSITTSQYKTLCEKYNYPVNDSYLAMDVAKFEPRDELDRLYTLENVRSVVFDIANKLFG